MSALPSDSRVVPRVTWNDALTRMDWRQGEHVTLIGPTGAGKTELTIALLATRKWGVFLNTKRRDRTQRDLRGLGYHKVKDGVGLNPEVASRYIVSPPWDRKLSADATDRAHAAIFTEALTRAFWQGGWTVAIDELEYINRDLRIDSPVNRILRQGRSADLSLISGTQRPRHVTLHAYEQATHLYLWRQSDMANITRAAELAGVNRQAVVSIVSHLDTHDALYVNTVTGDMFITNTRS